MNCLCGLLGKVCYCKMQKISEVVDIYEEKLQEAYNLIEGLKHQYLCWCPVETDLHTEACQAAQDLMAKVKSPTRKA